MYIYNILKNNLQQFELYEKNLCEKNLYFIFSSKI